MWLLVRGRKGRAGGVCRTDRADDLLVGDRLEMAEPAADYYHYNQSILCNKHLKNSLSSPKVA